MSETPAPTRRSWLVALPAILFAALALLFLSRMGRDPQKLPSTLIGRAAPTLVLPELTGSGRPQIAEGALKGQVSVVNVFASWCVPCLDEHPQMMKLAEDKRLRLIGLNYKDQNDNALRFLSKNGNPYSLIGVDPAGRAVIDWGVYGVPETFVVDATGTVRYKFVGPVSAEALEKVLKPEIEKAMLVK